MSKIAQRGAAEIEQEISVRARSSVSWDDLRVFLVCSKAASFRSAARTLLVSSSTVTRRIERLEHSLRVPLFHRTPEGMALTHEGKLIAAQAREMEHALFNVERTRSLLEATERGSVTIAVTEGLGAFWLMPKLIEFQREKPYIQIRLLCAMESVDVLRLEADIAIQFVQPTNKDAIVSKIGRLHLHPFASRSYLDVYGVPKSNKDLHRHRLVQQVAPQLKQDAFAKYFDLENIDDSVAIRTNSSTAHLYAIEKGAGIGVLPTFAAALGGPVEPLDIGGQYHLDIFMTYHPAARRDRHVAMAIKWIREIFDGCTYPCFADQFTHPDKLRLTLPGNAESNMGYGFSAVDPACENLNG